MARPHLLELENLDGLEQFCLSLVLLRLLGSDSIKKLLPVGADLCERAPPDEALDLLPILTVLLHQLLEQLDLGAAPTPRTHTLTQNTTRGLTHWIDYNIQDLSRSKFQKQMATVRNDRIRFMSSQSNLGGREGVESKSECGFNRMWSKTAFAFGQGAYHTSSMMLVLIEVRLSQQIMFLCCQDGSKEQPSQAPPGSGISEVFDDSSTGTNSIMFRRSLFIKYAYKSRGSRFADPEFPPNEHSLGYQPQGRKVAWKRVSEIVPDCLLFEAGIEETDVQTGNPADVYFLPTIAALARHPNRIRTIFHPSPSITAEGIYCLLVKEKGVVRELVIDDYVPVYTDSGRPAFCKANGREVWVMLLEKAWAKLKGSYGAMLTGCPHEVLSAFCIGPCRSYDLLPKTNQLQQRIWEDVRQAISKRYVICATSTLHPSHPLLLGRRIFSILGCSDKGTAQIRLHNYWRQEVQEMARIELPNSGSVLYSPSGRVVSSAQVHSQQLTLTLEEFLLNFDRIDISHENGKFHYDFKELEPPRSPFFLELEVQEEHEAYLALTLPQNNARPQPIRLLLAKGTEEGGYTLQHTSCVQQFEDCFVHVPQLSCGRHVLMVSAELPKEPLVLSYSYRGASPEGKAKITQLLPQDLPTQQFLASLFFNHSENSHRSLLSQNEDLIRSADLFEECGYGYVVCQVPARSTFRLGVLMNHQRIEASGMRLVGGWGERETVRPGEREVFVFEHVGEQLDSHFPPDGFSIAKVI